jgi:hypothetical protein
MATRRTKKPAPEPAPSADAENADSENADSQAPPEFLNRAARRAQSKGKQAPKPVGKITPGHQATPHSTRQWANRRSG